MNEDGPSATAAPRIISADPEIDGILARRTTDLGPDLDAYRGHVYRVFNYCAQLAAPQDRPKVAVAAAFHDLGIWTAGTFDYLDPSVALARAHLEATDRVGWDAAVAPMIRYHHKLRPYRGRGDDEHTDLVEAFRRADLADLSWGALAGGWNATFVKALKRTFPSAGFHARVCQIGLRWALRNPLRPLPMMQW